MKLNTLIPTLMPLICWNCYSSMQVTQAVTGQLADATGDFACLVFFLSAASASPRVVQSATCPVRELAIRELSSYRVEYCSTQSLRICYDSTIGLWN